MAGSAAGTGGAQERAPRRGATPLEPARGPGPEALLGIAAAAGAGLYRARRAPPPPRRPGRRLGRPAPGGTDRRERPGDGPAAAGPDPAGVGRGAGPARGRR